MTLAEFNRLPPVEAVRALLDCCGSSAWTARMTELRPFAAADELMVAAARVWLQLGEADWLEAFAAHPRIGERTTSAASSQEQAAVYGAADRLQQALAAGNAAYEQRFGFIFIVSAAGKTPGQILEQLHKRLDNTREQELTNAAAEQMKITRLRLERMLSA